MLVKFVFEKKKKNIVGKGENTGLPAFFLSLQCFQKHSSSGYLEVGIVWKCADELTKVSLNKQGFNKKKYKKNRKKKSLTDHIKQNMS